jgi:hypothetical protein
VTPKRAVSYLLLLSLLIISLPFAVQSAPHGPSDRPSLPGALPSSAHSQTGQSGLPDRGAISPANLVRRASRRNLKSQFSETSFPSGSSIFLATATYGTGGQYAYSVAEGNLIKGGYPDLVVANYCASSTNCANGAVGVLLGNGDGTFQPAVSYGTGGLNAISVTIQDVNGDGIPDVLVANECADNTCVNGSVSVLLGNGDGTLQSAVSYVTGGQYAISVAVGNLITGGYPDLVVANRCASSTNCANGSVSVLLGNGDGTFQGAVGYATGGQDATSVAVADLIGKGIQDLVVSNECADDTCANGSVSVLLGNGDGTFQAAVSYSTGGEGALSAAVGDVNADGFPDLVVANYCASSTNCANGSVSVLLGNGDGTFQAAESYATGGQYAISVAVQDLNGDGHPDLVVTNEGSNNLGVLLGVGGGTFQTAVTYATAGQDAYSVVVGDVNGDGHPDLMVANRCASSNNCTNGSVSVLLGVGDGTFLTPPNYATGGEYAYSAALADVNGDGHPDLVVANECGINNCPNGAVSVLLGNGDGTFKAAVSYSTGGQDAYSVAVANLIAGGPPDLVVANECAIDNCASGSVSVLIGNGDGTFNPAVSYATGGQTALSVAVADLIGKGIQDLVVANESSNSVGVLLGNGDGTFQPAVTYATGGYNAYSVAVADLIANGPPDLVVANECAVESCTNGSVSVLLGNGDGTFQAAVSYPTLGQNTYSVAIGDVNGDGKPDVVVANQCVSSSNCTNGSVNVLLGNGDGTFQTALSTSTPFPLDFPAPLALADFNGDTKLDVASGSGDVLLLGNGDGTFQSPLTLGAFGAGIAAADVNLDGKPDLAVTNGSNATILVNISTTVGSSENPAGVGQSVTFTATVAGKFGGTVTFTSGSTTMCSNVTLSGGQATCTYAGLPVGSNTVTATYKGDHKLISSNGKIVETIVSQATTTTTLVSSVNPSESGKPVTFTARVSSSSGTPTGDVQFLNGKTVLATVKLKSGSAKYTTSKLPPGTNIITAVYDGNSKYSGSTSAPVDQIVLASTTTTLTSAPNPSTYGEAVTFTAVVTSSIGPPPNGETVSFMKGKTVLGTGKVSSGSATFTISTLKVGTTSVTAVYDGDSNFEGSKSNTVKQVVKKAGE